MPDPATQTPTTPVQNTSPSKSVPPPVLLIQSTLPMIPTIKTKQRKGKNSRALKKPRKVLVALVNTQLTIDKQRGIHLITLTSNPNEQFTYHAPNQKGNPFPMPAITQYYDDDTLEPEVACPDDQWEERCSFSTTRRRTTTSCGQW